MTTLNPVWRERIWWVAGVAIALVMGVQVAVGGLLLPLLVAGVALIMAVYHLRPQGLGRLVLVGILAGYFIGNRGFAQLMPIPNLPLLPAEAALALLVGLLFLERAKGNSLLPIFDSIGAFILVWIIFGAGRFVLDFRVYGVTALRDFAMVYYGVFYFAARMIVVNEAEAAESFMKVLRVSAVIMGGLFLITQYFPELVFEYLLFRGVPLVFYKHDLVGLFAAIGIVLQFLRWEEKRRMLNLIAAAFLLVVLISTDNRAALVGLAAATGWVALAGRWRLPVSLIGGGLLVALLTIFVTHLQNNSWRDTPLLEVYEAAASIVDTSGDGSYSGEGTFNKGDNNTFRLVWWRLVWEETWHASPLFGMGFGYDIAAQFQREYFADISTDFNARSPHNIFLTIFSRMGFVGLLAFGSMVVIMAFRTWHVTQSGELLALGAWAAAWVLLAGATFGVVLEGPMGAVVFWVLLGTASGLSAEDKANIYDESAEPTDFRGNSA